MDAANIRVLYVEDDPMDAELMIMNLERYTPNSRLTLEIIDSVAQAKSAFDTGAYNAAIIDWNLADGSGTELARHIRNSDQALPILFLSSIFTPDRREEAKQFKPSACLEKDYSREQAESLNSLIRDMLRQT